MQKAKDVWLDKTKNLFLISNTQSPLRDEIRYISIHPTAWHAAPVRHSPVIWSRDGHPMNVRIRMYWVTTTSNGVTNRVSNTKELYNIVNNYLDTAVRSGLADQVPGCTKEHPDSSPPLMTPPIGGTGPSASPAKPGYNCIWERPPQTLTYISPWRLDLDEQIHSRI